ncbi:MAG: nucleotide exchange factor GrpE [Alphaproteobacteria bacterium]
MNKDKKDLSENNNQQEEQIINSGISQEETVISEGITAENEVEIETKDEINIEALQEENKRLREDFLRTFADGENIKKRAQQEIEKNNKYAISSFGKSLLSVADNLQRAIDSTKEQTDESCENLLKGIELTQEELKKVFARFEIFKMEIMNTIFDPNFHQVVQEVEDKSKPAGTIIAELQAGYMINDRILREAMVVVTK